MPGMVKQDSAEMYEALTEEGKRGGSAERGL